MMQKTDMIYEILPMNIKHIKDIALLEKECFSSPWTEDNIAEELDNPCSHFLVAVKNNKVTGYIGVQEICGEAYITNVAVSEEYRRNGIACALLKKAINDAKSRECVFITLEVRESNSGAIRLYESLGFKINGIRKNFYSNPVENGIIYTLNFEGESLENSCN